MEFEAPDYCEEGIADFMHAIGDESYLSAHEFYKKLGFLMRK